MADIMQGLMMVLAPSVRVYDEGDKLRADVARCRECKHWGATASEGGASLGLDGKRRCARFEWETNDHRSLAYLESGDSASSSGALWTDAEFGCLAHEQKGQDA